MLYGLNDKMQKISLPPLANSIHVSVPGREPPQRSWSRFKKVLIDNPKDSDLLHRQKLWNFQKLNRGAFRSHLSSLPDIPYRVHNSNVETKNVAVQADVTEPIPFGARILFARLATRREKIFSVESDSSGDEDDNLRSDQRHKACSPITAHSLKPVNHNNNYYSDDFEDDSSEEDLDRLIFDSVIRRQNAGTMTDTKRKRAQTPKKDKRHRTVKPKTSAKSSDKQSILKVGQPETPCVQSSKDAEKKSVKFESNDGASVIPPLDDLDLAQNDANSRPTSSSSDDSDGYFPQIPMSKMGHSSHLSLDNLSILDILSGSKTDRSRVVNKWQPLTERLDGSRKSAGNENKANRIWFEQIVGDKEVIDTGAYNSFARTRPTIEYNFSDSNDKYTDLSKSSSRKNAGGRTLSEESNKQLLSKPGQGKLSANSSNMSIKSRSTRRR